MPVESVYPALEPLLPRVRKPIQYVGGEVGSVTKDWDAADVRWALCYPDAYEVGLPNQGVQILYEVLNERDGVLAERTYSVWPDLEELMREHDLARIPMIAADRGDDDPIVLAGGHAAFNPEPIADFIDGAVLGDGEVAVLGITEEIRDWKNCGRPGGRDGLLLRLAISRGLYVPRFYDVGYGADGAISAVVPNRPGVP